jgi:hypothetical protein
MKLSDRLTRAGLAFLIFGTCAALLPGDAGNFMTASDACSSSSNAALYVAGTAVLIAAVFADPAAFGLTNAEAAGATGVAFDPVTQLYSFIYDSSDSNPGS